MLKGIAPEVRQNSRSRFFKMTRAAVCFTRLLPSGLGWAHALHQDKP
jgi:hypothetical protein